MWLIPLVANDSYADPTLMTILAPVMGRPGFLIRSTSIPLSSLWIDTPDGSWDAGVNV